MDHCSSFDRLFVRQKVSVVTLHNCVLCQDTMDFVAYVAKDEIHGRACHVIECGGGLAEDVITTIGQAFELRFKNYLAQRAVPLTVPSRCVSSFHFKLFVTVS